MIPVFDGHNDMVLRLLAGGSFFERDTGGHIDLVRAREGGLGGGFCAVFTRSSGDEPEEWPPKNFPPTPDLGTASAHTLVGMGLLHRLARGSDGAFTIVRSAAEIEDCLARGSFAALLHVEGAEVIDPDFRALETLHTAGLRSLGLVWSRPNPFGHGVPFSFPGSPDSGPGLTEAGRALVRALNELHMVVDLSHLTEQGFWDVASISTAPLVASHSNAHALTPTPRNLTDRQLDAIRDSGGIAGVNFAAIFLHPDGAPDAEMPMEMVVAHFDYLVNRMGIEHVGFGSDYDGALIPDVIGDASGTQRVIDALRTHGYDGDALTALAHGNWVRVLRQTLGA